MAVGIAFRACFAALTNAQASQRIALALDQSAATQTPEVASQPGESIGKGQFGQPTNRRSTSTRSEALTLLSTLQREARFVDLVCEPLDQFSDAQIGAAAREVLQDCRKTLDRLFAIEPLTDQAEGSSVQVPQDHSPVQFRLVGKGSGQSGTVVHRGWKATQCEMPSWHVSPQDALVLMPTEVEVS